MINNSNHNFVVTLPQMSISIHEDGLVGTEEIIDENHHRWDGMKTTVELRQDLDLA